MTEEIFYKDPYAKSGHAVVTSLSAKGQDVVVEFSATPCYPIGGGQPSDQATVTGPNGTMQVKQVHRRGSAILHQGRLSGNIDVGDEVKIELKWSHRHHCMRLHTAGHLAHEALVEFAPSELLPAKGHHGKKAYLEYAGFAAVEVGALQERIDFLVEADLPVMMSEATLEEIQQTCRFIPPGLPKNKPLRVVTIGNYGPVPCGGVHVQSTAEIGKLIVQSFAQGNGQTSQLHYRITRAD